MAIEIDWIARLRTTPSPVCPTEADLRAFIEAPEIVSAESFSHIVSGCSTCRQKLQEIVLHPALEALAKYLQEPENVPEEILFHCMSCNICQDRVREALGG
jgi:hypothetical protein